MGRSPAAHWPRSSAPRCPTSPSTTRAKSLKSKNRRTPPSSVLPMEGGARACLIAIAIALIALQSCGAGSDGGGLGPGRKDRGRHRAEADRDLRRPRLHRLGARLSRTAFRRRAAGHGCRSCARAGSSPTPSSTSRTGSTSAVSVVCSRSPSRPTTGRAGASTSTTPTAGGTSGSTSSNAGRRPAPPPARGAR